MFQHTLATSPKDVSSHRRTFHLPFPILPSPLTLEKEMSARILWQNEICALRSVTSVLFSSVVLLRICSYVRRDSFVCATIKIRTNIDSSTKRIRKTQRLYEPLANISIAYTWTTYYTSRYGLHRLREKERERERRYMLQKWSANIAVNIAQPQPPHIQYGAQADRFYYCAVC